MNRMYVMKQLRRVLMLLILSLLIVACAGEEGAGTQAVQGPALIMFYTDN
jgi:PBP1b-binding outer membrane lipoprotein LpoB